MTQIRGGWTRSSKNRSGSCSSRVELVNDASSADVDAIDIDEDDDDDAGIFSIANDCYSEDEYALTDEENDLSAVRFVRTSVNKDESAEEFLLDREAVFRFIQDSIADAIDKQKKKRRQTWRSTCSFIQ